EHAIAGMAAAHARRLHGARGGEIGRAEADAMHAWRGGGDRRDIIYAVSRLEDRMNQDRPADALACFELGEELVEIVNVPRSVDFRQHDDIELVSHRADDLDDIVERPGRSQRIDARPQPGRAEVVGAGQRDEALSRRYLG